LVSTSSEARASALIVHAHPEPASFTTAQAQVARESLQAQGYSVEFTDLYAKRWPPFLHRGECGYDALEPVVTYGPAHLDDIQRAEALQVVRHAFSAIDDRPLAATSRSRTAAAAH
jgi:putative NADPH-quinone reductase